MVTGSKESAKLPFVAVMDSQFFGSAEEAERNFNVYLRAEPVAVILAVDAAGGSKDFLNPHIRNCVGKGIPVFLLSKNYGRRTGIQRISYGPQSEALAAGATPLRDVNIWGMLEVVDRVRNAAGSGLSGEELRTAVINEYGIPETRTGSR